MNKTLDKVLLYVGIFLFVFVILMIIIFCVKDSIPDTLVSCVLGAGAVELLLSAWIKNTKTKYEQKDNEDNECNEEDAEG